MSKAQLEIDFPALEHPPQSARIRARSEDPGDINTSVGTKPSTKSGTLPHRASLAHPEERGAVFTRRETVEFILDLAEYTTAKPLHQFRLVEPSTGNGDFLVVIVE